MRSYKAVCFTLLMGLAACSGSDGNDTTTGAAAPPPSTTTSTTTPALVLTTEGPQPKPGIEARVKAEVDQRTDGITGSPLAVAGAGASLQTPKDWTTTKGAVTVAGSADKKAQIAASSFTGSADSKLADAAAALGLTGCEWNPAESLMIGKTTLAGSGADGLCTRGAAKVKTAYVAPQAEALLVVGAWEEGGDSAGVFGAMRSIAKAAGSGGGDGIAACCAALRQNAGSAPPDQKAPMLQAAAICDGLRNSQQGKAALAQVRGMLRAANLPSACR